MLPNGGGNHGARDKHELLFDQSKMRYAKANQKINLRMLILNES